MCILQLVLTTERAPRSRAETMAPSAGSLSMRSLTSCMAKGRDHDGYIDLTPYQPIQCQGPEAGQRVSGPSPKPREPSKEAQIEHSDPKADIFQSSWSTLVLTEGRTADLEELQLLLLAPEKRVHKDHGG